MSDRREFFVAAAGLIGALLSLFDAPRDKPVSVTVNITPPSDGRPTILSYEIRT